MPEFAYKARKKSGDLVEGVVTGADRTQALTQIGKLGLYPVRVDAAGGEKKKSSSSPLKETAFIDSTQATSPL